MCSIILTTEVVPKIFPFLNVVSHLHVPAGWGSCRSKLTNFNMHCTDMGVSFWEYKGQIIDLKANILHSHFKETCNLSSTLMASIYTQRYRKYHN